MGRFYSEVQNETGKGAEYHTLVFDDAARKYKKGFICVLKDDQAVSLEGWNSREEFEDMLGIEKESLIDVELLEVGESVEVNRSIYTRIW